MHRAAGGHDRSRCKRHSGVGSIDRQGRRQRVDPKSLTLELSASPAEGASIVTDPWHELGPIRPFAAVVLDSGGIQRSPGQVVGAVDDFEDYYRERGDGVLPWEPTPAEPVQPKLKTTAPATRTP